MSGLKTAAVVAHAALAEVGYAGIEGHADFSTPPDVMVRAFNIGLMAAGLPTIESPAELMALVREKHKGQRQLDVWQMWAEKWGLQ